MNEAPDGHKTDFRWRSDYADGFNSDSIRIYSDTHCTFIVKFHWTANTVECSGIILVTSIIYFRKVL